MTVYDDVEIEDMEWNDDLAAYTYECPCGDLFQISLDELRDGEDIAHCPSCTLIVRVIYDEADFVDSKPPPATIQAAVPVDH